MSAARTIAAARALNKRAAALCNVDAEDQWKVYSEDFIADAEAALAAADAVTLPASETIELPAPVQDIESAMGLPPVGALWLDLKETTR